MDSDLYKAYIAPELREGLKVELVSSTPNLKLETPPTRPIKPVLPESDPLNSLAIPPVPKVRVDVPITKIFPPVAVPIAVDLPAFRVIAFVVVFAVDTFASKVRSPVRVSTKTVPVAVMPVFEPTVPIVSPPEASVMLKEPNLMVLSPPASVPIALLLLFSVKVPVPLRFNPVAVNAAVWVTAPVASKLSIPLAADIEAVK
jgi:hypothetical protein